VPLPFSGFQVGPNVEPLSTSSTNSLLQDADGALFYVLDFFAYCINAYPGPRFVQACVAAGLTTPQGAAIAPVAQQYPYLITDAALQENQFRFPLLSVGRTKSLTTMKTASWEHDKGRFDLVYALPPLTPGQGELLLPMLHAVEQTLRYKCSQSFDPGYAPPGGTLGQSPWGVAFGALEQVGFGEPTGAGYADSVTYGFLEGMGNLFFPCIRMNGYMLERDMPNPTASGAVVLAGTDITAGLQASDGTLITGFDQSATTQVAPTIASLSVTSGPVAGGTVVFITGTGFIKGAAVSFGITPATNVVWSSATQMQCNAPAVQGAGTLPVTVSNPPMPMSPGVANNLNAGQLQTSQSVTLLNAFTYS
jgi:IPT/TIG domain-containing protein